MAWANVFYSIKQTRYLVGKLVRTQRCDVGALRERPSDILSRIYSKLDLPLGRSRIERSPIRLPFSFLLDRNGRNAWFIKLRVPRWVERKFNVPWSRMEKETSRKIRPS